MTEPRWTLPVLPTYALPLPIEVCRQVASFLVHPVTNAKDHAQMQHAYMLERVEESIQFLRRWRYENQRQFRDWKMDLYKVGCIQKVLERDPNFGVKALKWTSRMSIAYLSGSICTPAYTAELKVWPRKCGPAVAL